MKMKVVRWYCNINESNLILTIKAFHYAGIAVWLSVYF